MNKKTLLEIKDYTQHKIIYFSNQYRNEKISETSFSNWNARDVIGHINSWLQFSETIITLIQSKKSITEAAHVDVTSFNKASYEKYKDESLKTTVHESETRLEKYGNAAALFDENDLLQKDSSTGFDFPVWKYIAMDLLYHPIMHILYYYVKHSDYDEFAKEIENSKRYFMEYSDHNMNVYNFNEFFEDERQKTEQFDALKKAVKDNDFVNEIIKVNLN